MATVFRSKVDRKLKVIGFATPGVALLAIATSARGPAALWLPVILAVLVGFLAALQRRAPRLAS